MTYYDVDDYSVEDKNYFYDGDQYELDAYNINDSGVAKFVLVRNAENAFRFSNIAVVDRITVTKNQDDETVYKLYALKNGEQVNILTSSDLYWDTTLGVQFKYLKTGTVIAYKINSSGAMVDFVLLFDGLNKVNNSILGYDPNVNLIYGTVLDKSYSSLNVNNTLYYTGDSSIQVYKHDVYYRDIEYTDIFDITRGDNVYIYIYDGVIKTIMIVY